MVSAIIPNLTRIAGLEQTLRQYFLLAQPVDLNRVYTMPSLQEIYAR
ncbi:MAG: hypothetical protein AB1801_05075 [Chloroflexota bacterium]